MKCELRHLTVTCLKFLNSGGYYPKSRNRYKKKKSLDSCKFDYEYNTYTQYIVIIVCTSFMHSYNLLET